MKKEILLSIAGLHMIEEEDGNVEVVKAGDYYNRNGKHYVVYDEVVEGLSGHISNTIKIGDNSLEVMKRGLTNTRMIFEKGKKTLTRYQTPYGILDLSILARDVKVEETEDAIDVAVDYVLEVNEEHLAECNIKMNIRPREAGNLSLQTPEA
mgnify:FL=1